MSFGRLRACTLASGAFSFIQQRKNEGNAINHQGLK
jgi:hypothetical protein